MTRGERSTIEDVISAEMGRRTVLRGGVLGAGAFLASSTFLPAAQALAEDAGGQHLGGFSSGARGMISFKAIGTNSLDDVTVPEGYTAQPLIPWGEPIVPSGPAFKPDASNSAADQAKQLGMGHDGIAYFPLRPLRGNLGKASSIGLLALNHEYTLGEQLFPGGLARNEEGEITAPWDAENTLKEQNAHGVSVVEVRRTKSNYKEWETVESAFARRITPNTPMTFSGPVAGHRLVKTEADPDGTTPVGTPNNCGNGVTPWGTYITCEENFNGYFWEETEGEAAGISEEQAAMNERYGVGGRGFGYWWATTDERFRADLNPQEPNRFGWMVEIDPRDPDSTPIKHTALGRFKHEGAAFGIAKNGAVVCYMGDDERFDYLYKFVSAKPWKSEIMKNRNPLSEGTLYVAKFEEGAVGEWLPLVQGHGPLTAENGFADQGDVLVKARMAADLLGATEMDRPEWTAVHPETGEMFVTCTNNSRRTEANVANLRIENTTGHIIRLKDSGNDAGSASLSWDIYLLAGAGDGTDGSTIDAEDTFGSPDGLVIDRRGTMWIQTDGSQPDGSNNQMLACDLTTGEIRRFLVGPVDCEVTGVAFTPDLSTMFVNIQHPGDSGPADNPTETSTWPEGEGAARPRPATVAIRRADGQMIGT